MLLTYQCFSPGGLIGVTDWAGERTSKTSEHAPAVEGSALHTLVRAGNIRDTIYANLLSKKTVTELPGTEWGRPIWEQPPVSPLDAETSRSYLGRLVPLSRAIRLEEERKTFTLANGLAYPKLPVGRETSATVVVRTRGSDQSVGYIPTDLSRHPWRELPSILALSKRMSDGGALALRHLASSDQAVLDIWTGGLAADKAKILDVMEWTFALPTNLLNEAELRIYQKGIELAQAAETNLSVAVKVFCVEMKLKGAVSGAARSRFWSALDICHTELIRVASEKSGHLATTWYPLVRKAMQDAYTATCPHTTPRQIQAYALGLKKLRLKKPEE